MQKTIIVLVFTLICNVAFACDLCTVYIGLQPNDFKTSFGVRHRYRAFQIDYSANIASTSHTNNIKGAPTNKHNSGLTYGAPSDAYTYKETYNSYDIFLNLFLTQRLQLNLSTYFADNYVFHNDSIIGNIGGIGDLNMLLKYQLVNSQETGDTLLKNKFLHRLIVGGGISSPTGNYKKSSVIGFETQIQPNTIIGTPIMELDPHLQAGTGSFGYLFLMEYLLKFNNLGININNSYRLNTTNKNNFKFAHRFNNNASLFALLNLSDKVKLMPQTGLSFEKSARDQYQNQPYNNSGGEVLFSNFGFNLFIDKLSLEFIYYHPIYQSLYDDQPLNTQRLISQINYFF